MARPAATDDLDSERTARLWTPERVPLTVPLAGLGERALAYLIDLSLLVAVGMAGLLVYNVWGDLSRDLGALSGVGTLLLGLAVFGFAVSLDVICEVAFAGRTLGKRLLRLRVLRADGRPPDLFVAVLRNVLRILDILPFGYAVGTVALFLTGTRRLGDLVADTFVVTERSQRSDPLAACRAAAGDVVVARPLWSDADALRALGMVERTEKLEAKTARALCLRTLKRVDPASAAETTDPRAALGAACVALAAAADGVVGDIGRLVDVERELRDALGRLRAGCSVDDVERADAAIRRASTELMRAERRKVPARHLESLSLALLEAERKRTVKPPLGRALRRYLLHEVPRTVWSERALIARAGAVLAIGLFVGGAVAYANADLARVLVGDNVARHVEDGAAWTDAIEQNGSFAQASVQIIFNNVFVGLRVFAFGLLGGVATILGLLSNGVQIGATFGYALRLHTAETLLRFVCAHGPVELTMVSVAGAAGMCLGRALLSPGHRTRTRALREEGARGVRLLVAASMGFLCIGTVEGFVSPGRMFPTPVNLGIGLTLLALFWTWVRVYGARPAEP